MILLGYFRCGAPSFVLLFEIRWRFLSILLIIVVKRWIDGPEILQLLRSLLDVAIPVPLEGVIVHVVRLTQEAHCFRCFVFVAVLRSLLDAEARFSGAVSCWPALSISGYLRAQHFSCILSERQLSFCESLNLCRLSRTLRSLQRRAVSLLLLASI